MARLPSLRLTPGLGAAAAFAAATVVSGLVAWGAALVVERISASAVSSQLLGDGITWAEVSANGLQVHLAGTAPNEAARYRAINLAGGVVEASRIRDRMEVTPAKTVEAPRFSVEMLRNDDGIQLIGLLPEGDTRDALLAEAQALQAGTEVQNMLETASHTPPESWNDALAFGRRALVLLPRSKITVAADRVVITAIASSESEKRGFEADLTEARPEGLAVVIDISAPRPVITPFTLRFVGDTEGFRFDACSADTEQARARIIAAARAAGASERQGCTIGLGVPTPSWAEAAEAGIAAVAVLKNASVTFKDADVTLQAGTTVSQADFDRVVGELDTALPQVFSLKATLEKAENATLGPAEFTASLAAETGKVELRGRLADELQRAAVDSVARAHFGSANVYLATRMDPELPDGWPVRVLAGLEALAQLDHGQLLVRADTVEISGVTGSQVAKARIAQVLSDKLGQGKTYKVSVTYDEDLDPLAALPTPQECASGVLAVLERQKIPFSPGSAEIDAKAGPVMTALATALKDCAGVKMEIAGHTDAQGSEAGNLALSQARAEAVLLALQGRGVDVSGLQAKGYGESAPLADNETEAGREANRRIAFTLIGDGRRDKPSPSERVEADFQPKTEAETAADATATAAPASDASAEAPDFSSDTSPSVAPGEKTRRPEPRPDPSE